jgi:hypothetical protein
MRGAGPNKGPTVLHLCDVGNCTRQRLQTPKARAVLPHTSQVDKVTELTTIRRPVDVMSFGDAPFARPCCLAQVV